MAVNTPVSVEIKVDSTGSYIVSPVWGGVDRPITGGISTGKNKKLADRLAAAYMSGKIFGDTDVRTDCNGKTYVSSFCKLRGRALNADLASFGF